MSRVGLRRHLRRLLGPRADPPGEPSDYERRVTAEQSTYSEQETVHDLPGIQHYWGDTYLRPMLEEVGIPAFDQFFVDGLDAALSERPATAEGPARIVALGAGNCDEEVKTAVELRRRGHEDFVIECLEFVPEMLDRGREHARAADVERFIDVRNADANTWRAEGPLDGVIANQVLHHLVELEHVFDEIAANLEPHGRFVCSDMIGRNGHLRWPEARSILERVWDTLPESKKWHNQLNRQESPFEDWDCSQGTLEGIRAQDILPLLVERFSFEIFLGFANVIDPFIDRGFGPNYDIDSAEDRAVIDRVQELDQAALVAGEVSPCHILASMRSIPIENPRVWRNLTPEFSIRQT